MLPKKGGIIGLCPVSILHLPFLYLILQVLMYLKKKSQNFCFQMWWKNSYKAQTLPEKKLNFRHNTPSWDIFLKELKHNQNRPTYPAPGDRNRSYWYQHINFACCRIAHKCNEIASVWWSAPVCWGMHAELQVYQQFIPLDDASVIWMSVTREFTCKRLRSSSQVALLLSWKHLLCLV
jgi:hypothetical protein